MKVFLTWSGENSKLIAAALDRFIPKLLQMVDPFMSAKDVDKGSQWQARVLGELDDSEMGIICLTPDNLTAPWILFEAGALSKKTKKGDASDPRVYTYLHKLTAAQVTSPLSIFQHTLATKEETLTLMHRIRKRTKAKNPSEQQLNELFEDKWPKLEQKFLEVVPETPAPRREMRDMVEELLELTRGLTAQDAERVGSEKAYAALGAEQVARSEVFRSLLGDEYPEGKVSLAHLVEILRTINRQDRNLK